MKSRHITQKTNTKTCSSIAIRFNRPDFRIYRDGTNITPELTTDTIITDKELSQGNNYTYTVKVRNKVLEVSEATIAKWNDIDGGDVGADL